MTIWPLLLLYNLMHYNPLKPLEPIIRVSHPSLGHVQLHLDGPIPLALQRLLLTRLEETLHLSRQAKFLRPTLWCQ